MLGAESVERYLRNVVEENCEVKPQSEIQNMFRKYESGKRR